MNTRTTTPSRRSDRRASSARSGAPTATRLLTTLALSVVSMYISATPVGAPVIPAEHNVPTVASPEPAADRFRDREDGSDILREQAKLDQRFDDMYSAAEVSDEFWRAHWSEYFPGRYSSPRVTGAYDPGVADAPVCGEVSLGPDNAYYCPEGHYVAWGVDLIRSTLDLGDGWAYLVVAHEWGHAIQAQLDEPLVWPGKELQADCLAGATLYGAETDGLITMGQDREWVFVAGLNEMADASPWTNEGDHGDPFERVESFNLGRTGGVDACLTVD